MNILSELNEILAPLDIPFETGVFSGIAPDKYMVIVPLSDVYDLHADNNPGVDVQGARISLYDKGNYMSTKAAVLSLLLAAGLTITSRDYLGYEYDTGYHHYNIDVEQFYAIA